MLKVAVIGLSGESFFYKVDSLETGNKIGNPYTEVGGKGFNQVVTLKQLGAEVSFLTAVGKDDIGDECEKVLEELGVKTFIKRKKGKTSYADILVDPDGNNTVNVYEEAKLTIEDVESFAQEIIDADILLLQLEVPLEINKKAVEIAKQNHTSIVLNPAPMNDSGYILAQDATILTPNEEEAKKLFDVKDVRQIKAPINQKIIITLGSRGAILIAAGLQLFFAAVPVEPVVDTTGAGDVFTAAYIYYYHESRDDRDALRFANVKAAESVTKHYVLPAIPKK